MTNMWLQSTWIWISPMNNRGCHLCSYPLGLSMSKHGGWLPIYMASMYGKYDIGTFVIPTGQSRSAIHREMIESRPVMACALFPAVPSSSMAPRFAGGFFCPPYHPQIPPTGQWVILHPHLSQAAPDLSHTWCSPLGSMGAYSAMSIANVVSGAGAPAIHRVSSIQGQHLQFSSWYLSSNWNKDPGFHTYTKRHQQQREANAAEGRKQTASAIGFFMQPSLWKTGLIHSVVMLSGYLGCVVSG